MLSQNDKPRAFKVYTAMKPGSTKNSCLKSAPLIFQRKNINGLLIPYVPTAEILEQRERLWVKGHTVLYRWHN